MVGAGGYDKLSGERMAWRTLLPPFNLQQHPHPGQITFQLKGVYYRNLAQVIPTDHTLGSTKISRRAFEITHCFGEEPPPPEVLERTSARGSHVRGRTIENYRPREVRDGGSDIDSADEDSQRTPGKTDSMDIDDPGSAGRYPRSEIIPFLKFEISSLCA